MREINRGRHKTSTKGAPRIVRSPIVDKNNPDSYPSLIKYLEATGKLKHTTYAMMMKARSLYLRGKSVSRICDELKIEPSIVDRWALCFSWDEERDRRMFEQFRKVNGVSKIYGDNIGARHDRIAGSIEQITERRLQQHVDGKDILSTKDLKCLTDVIKSTQEIRRTVRGEKSQDKQGTVNNTLVISVPSNLDKLATALNDAMDRPKLIQSNTKTIAVGVEEAIGHDIDYEDVNRNSKTFPE